MHKATLDEIQKAIRNVPDFPKSGISFKDITPVLADARLFAGTIEMLRGPFEPGQIDTVVGIDARGFIFAAGVALQLGAGFVPIRKKGKLPFTTLEESYDLEYGHNTIALHSDALKPGSRVLLVDDVLATGGTAAAAVSLLSRIGADIREISFLMELSFLEGRKKLTGFPIRSLVTY